MFQYLIRYFRWIFVVKGNGKFKAHSVVRGYEEDNDFNFADIYAPIAKLSSVRLLFNLVLYHRSKIRQLDFNNTFLNGKLENLVHVRVTDGVEIDSKYSNPVLKVGKVLYGLRDPPKAWNNTLDSFLSSIGFWKE